MRLLVLGLCCALGALPAAAQDARVVEALVDRTAARMIPAGGPGCTVGLRHGPASTTRAYGMADLERGVALTPASILEAGSVSKQFTAAAIALLAIDGKLSFDDDARKWFPELPDYGTRITVRHLLTHTSGLRDWGSVAALEGWPRGTRAHNNEHALQIAARQQALNYAPGSAYSYTNTGYNLLALLVQRASGKTLAQFSRERLFEPLGMKSTSWRDNYERIVPGRALAYTGGRGAFTTNMPNEDAYGNGGLLTTVGDLLTWNEAMNQSSLGRALSDSVVRQFVLTNGRTIDYALGLFIVNGRGTREIQHSGSTAGYRAHLIRFPDAHISVAVLCNAGSAINATLIANQLADSLLPARARVAPTPAGPPGPVTWVHEVRRTIIRNPERTSGTVRYLDEQNGRPMRMLVISAAGDTAQYRREDEWRPDAAALASFTGTYSTPEVRGEPFIIAVENGSLVLRQNPGQRIQLTPAYRDAFGSGARMVWFTRDQSGRVNAMHIGEDRVWDIAFHRAR